MFALPRSHRSKRHPSPKRSVGLGSLVLVPLLVAGLPACKSATEETAGASAKDEVGRQLADLELPVSLRTRDNQPTDAHQIEATTEQLRVNGAPVVALQKGAVAPEDVREGVIPKLETVFRAQSHTTVAMRLEAIIPYETVALVLNTAKQAGVMNAAFQVREVGNTTRTGWLNVDSYVMSSRADDVPPIQTVNAKSWDAFTAKWKDVTSACRTAASGNCAYADTNFAKGGTLKIELHTSGRGLNINFFRRGLTPAQEHEEEVKRKKDLAKKKESFLQGHISHEEMVEYLLLGDPSTQALFQFRYQEALAAPSALSQTIAPVCGQDRCGVLIAADKISPMVRMITLMGAAFPDGSTQPAYAFEMPWTKRPIPTGLPEWASRELEKNEMLEGNFGNKK